MHPIVFQIIPCLLIASLIGFVVAKLLHRTNLRQLRDDIHIQNSNKNKLEYELSQLRSDLSSSKQDHEHSLLECMALKDQLITYQNQANSLQELVSQTEQQLASKNTAFQALSSEMTHNRQTYQKLEGDFNRAQQALTDQQKEIEQWAERHRKTQAELAKNQQVAVELRQSIEKEFKGQLDQMATQQQSVRQAHDNAQASLQSEHQRQIQKIHEAHTEALKHEQLKAQSELSSLQAEFARFQHQQQSQTQARLAQLHDLQLQIEDKDKILQSAQETHSQTLNQLQQQHAQHLQQMAQKHEASAQQMQTQIQTQLAALKNEQAKSHTVVQQLQDSQSKQENLMTRVQELGQRMSGLAAKHEHTQKLFNALKTVVS